MYVPEHHPQNLYSKQLAENTYDLEALQHSAAYEAFLLDNMSERTATLTCNNITVPHRYIPSDIHEQHGMPPSFDLSSFGAKLIELPVTEGPSMWLFSAQYVVGDKHYSLSTSEEFSTLTMRGEEGKDPSVSLDPQFATRLLSTIAVGALIKRGIMPSRKRVQQPITDSYDSIDTIMERISNVDGTYQSHLTASLSILGYDRAMVLELIETEMPDSSESKAVFRMAWQAFAANTTEIQSTHHATFALGQDASHLGDAEHHFAGRRPITISPDQLGFDVGATAGDGAARVFEGGDCVGEDYLIANNSIMTMLRPLLAPYAHLDTTPEIPMSLLRGDEH